MPRLRGHHLVCLHFFKGEGYDATFTENLRDTLSRAEDEGIEISTGADDVCAECHYLKEGICMQAQDADEEIREMDEKALQLLGFSVGDNINWKALKDQIHRIFPEWHTLYCRDCDWRNVCVKNGFFKTLLS